MVVLVLNLIVVSRLSEILKESGTTAKALPPLVKVRLLVCELTSFSSRPSASRTSI